MRKLSRIKKLENRKVQLDQLIDRTTKLKRKMSKYSNDNYKLYKSGDISSWKYKKLRAHRFQGRTADSWVKHYKKIIKDYHVEQGEIQKETNSYTAMTDLALHIVLSVMVLMFVVIGISVAPEIDGNNLNLDNIIGLTVDLATFNPLNTTVSEDTIIIEEIINNTDEPPSVPGPPEEEPATTEPVNQSQLPEENISETVPENITTTPEKNATITPSIPEPTIEPIVDIPSVIEENITTTVEENITVVQTESEQVIQFTAEIGKPVKWTKHLTLPIETSNVEIDLEPTATNITIEKVEDKQLPLGVGIQGVQKDYVDITNRVSISKGIVPLDSFGGILEFFVNLFSSITGLVTTDLSEENVTLTITEPIKEIVIEYYTEPPQLFEEKTSFGKRIIISSETHYQNIKTYTTLPEVTPGNVNLYWLVNESRQKIEFTASDTNSNGLVDYIEWITPHTSNETFEIDLIILNVQSFPILGGNWTVQFNTSGTANLTIRATNETTWSNVNENNDLKFLDVQCGQTVQPYEWINDSVFIQNYTCNNLTSTETSKAVTTGNHTLEFTFGNITNYAHNLVFPNCPDTTGNLTISGTTVWNQSFECNNVTIASGGILIFNSSAENKSINLTAFDLTIESGGALSSLRTGFRRGQGPGVGIVADTGGSYGGLGGSSDPTDVNSAYGSITRPTDLGSGAQDLSTGGRGGGSIFLNISNIIHNNGVITSNGSSGSAGGAAGGSVYIITTTLEGSGNITAIGGSQTGSVNDGSGGGGRIAIYYTTNSLTGSITAHGGIAVTRRLQGGAGTVFLKSSTQQFGDLLIDNRKIFTGGRTPVNDSYLDTKQLDNLIVSNASRIDHGFGTNGNFTVANLTIDGDSYIDLTVRGFAAGTGPGVGIVADTGGSYGGLGGGTEPSDVNTVYGNITKPFELGSGGQDVLSETAGGATYLNITNTLILNGTISANGSRSATGGSSGGSVFLITNNFFGTGNITAVGGGATTSGDGAGGGGRIAIYYTTKDFSGKFNARGGLAQTQIRSGGAGTIYQKSSSQQFGDLLIDNFNSPASRTPVNSSFLHTQLDNLDIVNNSRMDHGFGTFGNLTVANLTIDTTSVIDLTVRGFAAGAGPGVGIVADTGGTYGGRGGSSGQNVKSVGAPYGSVTQPVDLGSGGEDTVGSDAGGATFINITNTLILNGTISANGTASARGGSSGGSVFLITNNFFGTGNITAVGGGATTSGDGAGGGGRIAIYYTNKEFFGKVRAVGGVSVGSSLQGGAGTFFEKSSSQQFGDLIIDGERLGVGRTALNATHLTTNLDNLIIRNGSRVDHGNSTGILGISIGNLTILSSASIDVNQLGFAPGQGPGAGTATDSGGSHGGDGGNNPASTYGNLTSPLDPGSGAQDLTTEEAGGIIALNVTGTLYVNGSIAANGTTDNVGGSSGGSIYIVTNKLSGLGTIDANGGGSTVGSDGAGAGGRIALYVTNNTFTGRINFSGGRAPTANFGGLRGSLFICNSLSGTSCIGVGGSEFLMRNGSITVRTFYSRNTSINITRNMETTWNTEVINWTDESSNISTLAIYNVTGLTVSKNYNVFDNDVFNQTLTTDSSGRLPLFNISLSSQHNISLQASVNSKPVITSVLLNATTNLNQTYDNLTAHIVSSDGDGDTIKHIYEWQVDGESIQPLIMPFEPGSSDSSVTRDYSMPVNNGTVTNATFSSTTGYDGRGAYIFRGNESPSLISVENSTTFNFAEYTLNLWVKPNDNSRFQSIIHKQDDGTGDGFLFQINTAQQYIFSTGSQTFSVGSVTEDAWTFFSFAYNGSILRVVTNGGSPFEFTVDEFSPSVGGIFIGNRDNEGFPFNGTLDEINIYDRALSPEQISLIYNNITNVTDRSVTSIGEIWTVNVFANDGIDDGNNITSNNVTIINFLPTVDEVILNATSSGNTTNDNLTAHVTTSDTNSQDNITVIYDWIQNGEHLANLILPFEGGSNGTHTKDYSVYSNNGTVTNATWLSSGGYDHFGAYTFKGNVSPSLIFLDNSTGYNITNYTLAAWIHPNDDSRFQSIIHKQDDGTGDGFLFQINAAQQYIFSTGSQSFTVGTVSEDQWTFFAFAFNGTTLKTSTNGGTFVENTVISYTPSIGGIFIGNRDTQAFPFNGTLDQIHLYNRTLSQDQVLAIYENKTNVIVSAETEVNDIWNVKVTANDGFADGGNVTSNNFTIVPSVIGITLNDSLIDFGSGFFNQSSTETFSILNSNTSKVDWINTTAFPFFADFHSLENTGNVALNISVNASLTDAEVLFCGSSQGCSSTSSRINIRSLNGEASSCASGLTNSYEVLANDTTSVKVGLCDSLGPSASTDELNMTVELISPSDTTTGSHSVLFVYEAIAA